MILTPLSIPTMQNKKKLVFVVPQLCIGGVSSSLLGLLRLLPFERFDVMLLLFSGESELLSTLPPQVHIQYATAMEKREKLRSLVSKALQTRPLRPLFHLCKGLYHRFGGVLSSGTHREEQAYDVAISYQDGLATWYVAKQITAKRKIAFVHTDFAMAQYNIAHEEKVYHAFDQICFASLASKDSFLSCMPQFASHAIFVPNVVDRKVLLERAEQGKGFSDAFEGLRILTVGRLSHEKGSHKIPKIIRNLEDTGISFRWYLIGDGPLRESLEQADCKELVLLGLQSNPYPFFKQCDLYVQPSDYEGYCIALAEARVFSKPAVVCDFLGAREQLKNAVTGLITGFSEEELCEGIKTVLGNKALRAQFTKQLSLSSQENFALVRQWIDCL